MYRADVRVIDVKVVEVKMADTKRLGTNDPADGGTVSRYPRAIVWDLDGTLIDSLRDIASSLNILLGEYGLGPLDHADVRLMVGDGAVSLIERGFAACDKADLVDRSLLPRFLSIYAKHASDTTRLYPGAAEALDAFADAGVRQGICTNKPEQIARQLMNSLGISRYFDVVVGGDTVPRKKPDPLPLQHVLTGLGAGRDESLMVGDSAVDVATARAAGVRVVLVSNGYGRVSAATLGADLLLDELAGLPAAVVGITPRPPTAGCPPSAGSTGFS